MIAWHTTRVSKEEALAKLQAVVENEGLTIPAEFTQLVSGRAPTRTTPATR
jgi:hypothetical protein